MVAAAFTVVLICCVPAVLTAKQVKLGPVLLQVLRMPLFQLPQLITQLVNAQVAIGRLQEFLAAEEQPPMETLPPAKPGNQHWNLLTSACCSGTFTLELH